MNQTPSDRIDETHRDFVAALARGLSVIHAFSENQPEMTLSEGPEAAQMNVATARRALLTPHLARLRRSAGQAFSVAAKSAVAGRRSIIRRASVGYRLPAFCTSLGRDLLASQSIEEQQRLLARAPFPQYTAKILVQRDDLARELAKALTDGFATQQDEIELGVISIALPICDPQGSVIAAINCSSETDRTTTEDLIATRFPALREARAHIEWAIRRAPALVHSIRSSWRATWFYCRSGRFSLQGMELGAMLSSARQSK